MERTEPCVLTNMCMVYDGDKVLVQNRVKSGWPGVTFPGGHVEPTESFVDSVIREVKEETGLTIQNVKLCGIKQFSEQEGAYRYIVLFFKTNDYSGSLASSEEGEVFWVQRSELCNYTLAEGFEGMLEVFENDDLSENYNWLQEGLWQQQNK